ncbi:MAG: DinB family protein [Bacteroidota bacterium]
MNAFQMLRATRQNAIRLVADCNMDQLNHIPAGFNNNLIWNLGHMLVTQQLLCYRLSQTPCLVEDEMIARYRKGTRPEGRIEEEEWTFIRQQLISSVGAMTQDHASGRFGPYKSYSTSYGVTLDSIDEAIHFNNMHEAMHLGTMLALKKLV